MMSRVLDWDNLHAAFRRVAASAGRAGVDGVTIKMFSNRLHKNLDDLRRQLSENKYRPWPLLRFQVAKPDGSPRGLSVPAVRDRVAQAAVLNITEPLFESEFEECSFAYRKGRSVKSAAMCVRDLRDKGYKYVVEVDIVGYFDNINHDKLLLRIADIIKDNKILQLIKTWIKAEIYNGKHITTLETGIPQGAVIAPVLANLFLDDLDEAMLAQDFKIIRYSDDFVVLAKTAERAARALELTEEVLNQLDLSIDWKDTCVTEFNRGFKFLGLTFLGDTIFTPFDCTPKKKKILYMPPPLDLGAYLAGKRNFL